MQNLRRQVAGLWILILAMFSIMAVQIATCDCPSRIVRGQINEFIEKATTDPLSGKYAGQIEAQELKQ